MPDFKPIQRCFILRVEFVELKLVVKINHDFKSAKIFVFFDIEIRTYLPRGENIVEVLQECLVFDLLVCEHEGQSLALSPSCLPVLRLQILHQISHVVRSEQNIEVNQCVI